MSKPIFTQIDAKEIRLDYKGMKFLLKENSRGVYGIGSAVQLYQLDGLKKEHIKEIGWTKSDNHGGPSKSESYLSGIVTFEDCKKAAVKYIDSLL